MKSITIQGTSFEVSTPYAAGHVLTEAEANTLNQTRCENVRNNTAKAVKDLLEAGKPDEAKAVVTEYDEKYEFGVTRVGSPRVVDPVEREARAIAKAAITAKLAADGRKLKDIDKEVLEAKIAEVASMDKVQKRAKQVVAERKALIDSIAA